MEEVVEGWLIDDVDDEALRVTESEMLQVC